MARSKILLTYIGTGAFYSVDAMITYPRQFIRHTFQPGESFDVTDVATLDEMNRNPILADLLNPSRIGGQMLKVTVVAGTSDIPGSVSNAAFGAGRILYLSPTGSDANTGAKDSPLLTPGQAEKLLSATSSAFQALMFAPGVYSLRETSLMAANSHGSASAPPMWVGSLTDEFGSLACTAGTTTSVVNLTSYPVRHGTAASFAAGAAGGQIRITGLTGMVAADVGRQIIIEGATQDGLNREWHISQVNSATSVDVWATGGAPSPSDGSNGSIVWREGFVGSFLTFYTGVCAGQRRLIVASTLTSITVNLQFTTGTPARTPVAPTPGDLFKIQREAVQINLDSTAFVAAGANAADKDIFGDRAYFGIRLNVVPVASFNTPNIMMGRGTHMFDSCSLALNGANWLCSSVAENPGRIHAGNSYFQWANAQTAKPLSGLISDPFQVPTFADVAPSNYRNQSGLYVHDANHIVGADHAAIQGYYVVRNAFIFSASYAEWYLQGWDTKRVSMILDSARVAFEQQGDDSSFLAIKMSKNFYGSFEPGLLVAMIGSTVEFNCRTDFSNGVHAGVYVGPGATAYMQFNDDGPAHISGTGNGTFGFVCSDGGNGADELGDFGEQNSITGTSGDLKVGKMPVISWANLYGGVGSVLDVKGDGSRYGSVYSSQSSPVYTMATTLTDFPTGGSIGTAPNTVDKYETVIVPQTTAAQTVTLASPTLATTVRMLKVVNSGSASVSVHAAAGGGATLAVAAGRGADFLWNGATWLPAS